MEGTPRTLRGSPGQRSNYQWCRAIRQRSGAHLLYFGIYDIPTSYKISGIVSRALPTGDAAGWPIPWWHRGKSPEMGSH
ncbi:MAG: hypothetical protein ACTSYB_07255 [Candidatus Helarchaeota archaeon]